MSSLGVEFPKEQARLRVILQHATEIGPAGQFLRSMINDCLERADKAVMEQDLPAMISIFAEMQEFSE